MAGDVVYGVNAVSEVLREPQRVNRVYFAKESRARPVAGLIDQTKKLGIPYDFIPQAKLNDLTDTREHQGVAAAVSPLEYATLDECLEACTGTARLLVLDQVQNPKNLGMLIRTAAGAGVSGVLIPMRGNALLDETVVRASAGTVFHVPVVTCANVSQTIQRLQNEGFWVYALDGSGTEDVFGVDWPERTALVVGNETDGIRPGVLKACDVRVRIPLDKGLDSLNVSVAAGVGLFLIAAQQRAKHGG